MTEKYPLVSIGILTKNAGSALIETLKSIINQETDFIYELIVLDSGSRDETVSNVEKYGGTVSSIKPEQFNFGTSRDLLFSLCRGEYIVTISQDVVPCNSKWLQNLIKPLQQNVAVCAVKGDCKLPEGTSVFFWEAIGKFYFTKETEKWDNKYGTGLSFVNCAVRKSFWLQNKIGFAAFSEDKVFQKSIIKAGGEIVLQNGASVFHGHQYNLHSLTTRLIGEGYGWRCVGLRYGLKDCIHDLITSGSKMMLRAIRAFRSGKLLNLSEWAFPLLRPILILYGNAFSNALKR